MHHTEAVGPVIQGHWVRSAGLGNRSLCSGWVCGRVVGRVGHSVIGGQARHCSTCAGSELVWFCSARARSWQDVPLVSKVGWDGLVTLFTEGLGQAVCSTA